mgnify:FL=1
MRKVRMRKTGRVQGGGFGCMTKVGEGQLGIWGCATNEDDGSVVIEAMGPDEALETFIEKVKASPAPYGRVASFTLTEDPTIELRQKFYTN